MQLPYIPQPFAAQARTQCSFRGYPMLHIQQLETTVSTPTGAWLAAVTGARASVHCTCLLGSMVHNWYSMQFSNLAGQL